MFRGISAVSRERTTHSEAGTTNAARAIPAPRTADRVVSALDPSSPGGSSSDLLLTAPRTIKSTMAVITAVAADSFVRPAKAQAVANQMRVRRVPSYRHAVKSTRPPAAAPAVSEPRYAALVARPLEAATKAEAATAAMGGAPTLRASADAAIMKSASHSAPVHRATDSTDQPVSAAMGRATTAVAT